MGQFHEAQETLIFQHIPKTAGTTLSFIIAQHFAEKDIYHIRNLNQMRGPAYSKHFGSIENFKNLDSDERNSFSCIIGHAPFGLHAHLNHQAKYITFVRDPVRRAISQYYQHRRMVKTNELVGDELSLEEFIEEKRDGIDNYQTRYISGLDHKSYSLEENYAKALTNIDKHFSLVGVVERFDESLLLLSQIFGWNQITYIKRNTTAPEDSLSDIDSTVINRIREINHYDASLYDHTVSLLDDMIWRQGERFSDALKGFKRRQIAKETKYKISLMLHGFTRRLIQTIRHSNS